MRTGQSCVGWSRYYTGTLKVSPERAGILLAVAQLVNFPGTALGGYAEAMMLKRMPALAMTKTLTIAASFGEAAFAILYGLAPTAIYRILHWKQCTLTLLILFSDHLHLVE